MFIELVRLKHGDSDLDELIRIHQEPSVSRFLSTSDNYDVSVKTTFQLTPRAPESFSFAP